MNEQNRLIEMELHRLDCYACAMEAVYGIGNLLEWMPDDFKEKWHRQQDKLAHAVEDGDAVVVRQLVHGCLKAWDMMKENADVQKRPNLSPECMEVVSDGGLHIRIAKNASEARILAKEGYVVWSLKEVARIIEKDYTLVNKIKDIFPDSEMKNIKEKSEFKDSEMPF
jgi:hypothetical protein